MRLTDRRWIRIFFWFGAAVSLAMVARSQVAGDQLNLLGLGWRLVFEGYWAPHGVPTSGGGMTPGGLTALLTGAPLLVWRDHRATALLVLVSHLAAYWLLDRLLRRVLPAEERFLFAVLYWLNPWRLYHSAFLWNANYLFIAGSIHLWTAHRLRARPRFWASFGHVLTLGMVMQVAVTALPLIAASLLLWWRRFVRLHLGGALAASALVALSLVPWAVASAADPALLPASEGGGYFYLLNTSLRATIYWLRYPSFALSAELFCLDFGALFGPAAVGALALLTSGFSALLYLSTLPVSIWANWRLFRGRWSWWRHPATTEMNDRAWLEGVVRWSLVAVIVTFSISPVTVSRWYVFGLFHAAVLPLVLAGGELLRGAHRHGVERAAWLWAGVSCALALALMAAAPAYRCGGERCSGAATIPDLRGDHPMLETLGIQDTCPVEVDVPGGWWPRVLPEPAAPGGAPEPAVGGQ